MASALAQVLQFADPADRVLHRFFKRHPGMGARDRQAIAETVFGVLRHGRLLEHLTGGRDPRSLVLTYLTRIRGISQRQSEARLGPKDQERIQADAGPELPLGIQADLPDWIVDKLATVFPPERILALGSSLQQPAPLDLRIHPLKITREKALAELRGSGLEAEPTPYSPLGIRLRGRPALGSHPLFTQGAVEVQDEGSQLVGFLVAPRRQHLVVDFCAGAGGKTLLLGALMGGRGQLYALDVAERRLARALTRIRRADLSNVQPWRIDGATDPKLDRLVGKADRVLVDAPCSGTGTLRRNPDLKWRQSAAGVAQLTRKQSAILAAAARLVKPGGRLIYATCSLLPEENPAIVAIFRDSHPEFALLRAEDLLREQGISVNSGEYLQLFPDLHGCDGFFAAVLEKRQG